MFASLFGSALNATPPPQIVQTARADFWLAALFWSSGAALLWFARNDRRFAVVLLAFLFIDLMRVARDVAPTVKRTFYDTPAIARRLLPLLEGDKYRLFPEYAWPQSRQTEASNVPRGLLLWAQRNALAPHSASTAGMATVYDTDIDQTWLLPTSRLVDVMWKVARCRNDWPEPFMAMGNARVREVFRRRLSNADDLQNVSATTFVVGPSLPRYYFADQVVSINSDRDMISGMCAQTWSPRVAFVDAPLPAAHGTVLQQVERTNDADLHVQTEGPALLVMSVTPHRYWSATVDGRTTQLRAVNIGYQGLVIPAGDHRVRMTYRNPFVLPLGFLSLLTVAILMVLQLRRPSFAA
jgi:hypothetical protein